MWWWLFLLRDGGRLERSFEGGHFLYNLLRAEDGGHIMDMFRGDLIDLLSAMTRGWSTGCAN